MISAPRRSRPRSVAATLIAACGGCLLVLTLGCGGGGAGGNPGLPGPSRFLYASVFQETSPGSGKFTGGIYAYQFDPRSGALTVVGGSPFANAAVGAPMVLSRDARFLYSLNFATDGSLAAYSIQSDGSLAALPGAPYVTTEPTRWLITDPAADFLYAIAYSGDLTVFAINPSSGMLTQQTVDGVLALGWPSLITPDGQRLYQVSPSEISEFSIDPTRGALTPLAGSPVAVQTDTFAPGGAAIDPSGRFIYVTNSLVFTGFGGAMYAWSIDPQTGAVTPIEPFSATAGPQTSVAVDASDKYAVITTEVTSKTGPNCLAVQGIDPASGALTPVPGSPFGGACGVLIADPTGAYLYDGSGGVSVYFIDEATGVPQLLTSSALPGMSVSSLAVTH